MKRFGNLYPGICSEANLILAEKLTGRGLKNKTAVYTFRQRLFENLAVLRNELLEECYQSGKYHLFKIWDPKERNIHVLPYRDRIVQHALCNILVPCFEKKYIYDSYANRKGKGTHAAVRRFLYFARKRRYVLKCDIVKFFPSMNRNILKDKLERVIKCKKTINLCRLFIDHPQEQSGMAYYPPGIALTGSNGLPIGNLTSQHFCNLYLNYFDHYVTERLKCDGYIRYVDDFVLFADDKARLKASVTEIKETLRQIGMVLHPNKTQIRPVSLGTSFLGYRIFPNRIALHGAKTRQRMKKLSRNIADYRKGRVDHQGIRNRIMSWAGHAKHTHDWRLMNHLLDGLWCRVR